jgi:DNA-binding LacI/PurR family transcriptional regulator
MSDITLTQLARQLGLGKSTVQRALSGTGHVKPTTQARVAAAAKAAGYRRNVFFATLVAHRQRTPHGNLTIHYISRDLPRSHAGSRGKLETALLRESALGFGMDLVAVDVARDRHPRTLARRLWSRGSAGMLLGNCGEEFVAGLSNHNALPILSLLTATDLPYHAVGFDVGQAVVRCWQVLREAGHTRIGVALLDHTPPNADDFCRRATARALLDSQPGPPIPIHALSLDNPHSIVRWLDDYQPDAVISFSPSSHWFCHQRPSGRSIPCLTLHANTRSENAHVPGTAQPWALHAKCAIEQMDLMIRTGQHGVPDGRRTLLIDPVWHAGAGL